MVAPVRALALAVVAVLAASTGCTACTSPGPSSGAPTRGARTSSPDRRALLREAAALAVPVAEEGWAFARPSSPDLVTLLHATVLVGTDADRDRAVGLVRRPAGATTADRGLALGLATLAATGSPAVSDELATRLVTQAEAAVHDGDPSWLGVLLVLSRPRSAAARGATDALDRVVGSRRCADLEVVGPDRPPDPQADLTVLLRSLAAHGATCAPASRLLDRLLADDRWDVPLAALELADLVHLLPTAAIDGGERRLVQQLRREMTLRRGPAVRSLGELATAAVALRELRRPLDLPDDLRLVATNQVAALGGLPDRTPRPAGPFDRLLLAELIQERLLPTWAGTGLAPVDAAEGPVPDDHLLASLAEQVIASLELPGCTGLSQRTAALLPPARDDALSVAGREFAAVATRYCSGGLDPAAAVADARVGPVADRALRVWAALLATCLADPGSLDRLAPITEAAPRSLPAEPLDLAARAYAIDPGGSCTTTRALKEAPP